MHSGYRPRSVRAQSSVIGIVLIIGLTLAAASAVVVFGSATLDDGQQRSQIGQAEQAMTQFDSRAAQVALGDSEVQTVRVGGNGGRYYVDGDAGSVRVYHQNWTGSGDNETIFAEQSLGALVYENGNTKIAYQGGGVWRSDGEGSSSMISSPEFHYRDATLTFPIVRVDGSGSNQGSVSARVTNKHKSKKVFANSSKEYEHDTETRYYRNPIQEGNMTVEVESEYCEAWRSYFRQRTDGKVSECTDDTVTAQLLSLGTQGGFDLAMGSTLTVRGQAQAQPLEDFVLEFGSGSNSGFNNFQWTLHTTENTGRQFEIFIDAPNNDGDGNPVYMHVYYSEDGGDSYQSWVLNSSNGDAFTQSGEKEDATLTVDLLDESRQITYRDFGDESLGDGPEFSSDGDFVGDETIDGNYDPGDKEDLETVMQYYFGKAGDMDMVTDEQQQGNAGLDDGGSRGEITYAGDGRVVTFLHITDNEIEIELN